MGNFLIGIDLGATNIKIGLLNKEFQILSRTVLPTKRYVSKKDLINIIVNTIKDKIKEKNLTKNDISGIGIGVPGPIDFHKGVVHYFPNIPGWKEVALKDIIQSKAGIRVFIDNDVNLMALAESRLGVAKGVDNIVCLTLGSGIGGGVIVNGELYRGSSFSAGEIGHMPVNIKGPRCNCGGTACLERYIGNRYICEKAKRIFKKDITPEELSQLAKKGNKKAIKIWEDVGVYLGVVLTGIVNFFNPRIIVIGGGVSGAGSFLFESIRDTITKRAMPIVRDIVKIKKAQLGKDAGIIGAALLVSDNLN